MTYDLMIHSRGRLTREEGEEDRGHWKEIIEEGRSQWSLVAA